MFTHEVEPFDLNIFTFLLQSTPPSVSAMYLIECMSRMYEQERSIERPWYEVSHDLFIVCKHFIIANYHKLSF